MRLGLIAVSSKTGLGYQTRDYYRHLNPLKTMVVDISAINGKTQNPHWYPNGIFINGFPREREIELFLNDLDVVLTAETPYNFELFSIAKRRGVKTVCVENPEFYDYFKYPHLPMPDLIILPSNWMEAEIRAHAEPLGTQVVQLHHPVDRGVFKFNLRKSKKFVHVAGNPAVNDRNGTFDALAACPQLIVVTQKEHLAKMIRARYSGSRVFDNLEDNLELYNLGDILVFPRRYGGNCLPLNEALSCGMPVIMPNISPNNNLLPGEWLVPAYENGYFEPRGRVNLYSVDVQKLMEKIDWFINCDIEKESEKANQIAESISWKELGPKWMQTLESLL